MELVTVNPIHIESLNGNSYIYDDASQLILGVRDEDEMEWLQNNKEITLETINSAPNRFKQLINTMNLFCRSKTLIQEKKLIQSKKQKGIRQLILEVTESCNLRCKYCIFSDYYENTRNYSSNKMPWETAKRAIDQFFQYNLCCLKINPQLTPAITFYGGEPLINFILIKRAVNYIEVKYKSLFNTIEYSLTTNGVLLTTEIIKFLISKQFYSVISLDGDRDSNDRNRVDINNKGTFNQVIKNIKEFQKIEKELAVNPNVTYFVIATVYDFQDSIEKRLSALQSLKIEQKKFRRFSFVDNFNSSFYEKQDMKKSLNDFSSTLWRLYTDPSQNKFVYDFVNKIYNELILNISNRRQFQNRLMRNSCVPGLDKLMVTVEGNFHACEKVSHNYPVGNVETGLNFENIEAQIRIFNEINEKKCFSCSYSNLCTVCVKQLEKGDGSKMGVTNEICEQQKNNQKKLLQLYVSKKEFDMLEEN